MHRFGDSVSCDYCKGTYSLNCGGYERHLHFCEEKKEYDAQKRKQETDKKIKDALLRNELKFQVDMQKKTILAQNKVILSLASKVGTTTNYNNCTFKIKMSSNDAINSIKEGFQQFIEFAKPFIKENANDPNIQEKLIALGKQSENIQIKKIAETVVEKATPFKEMIKTHDYTYEDIEKVESCYDKEVELLLEELNTELQEANELLTA